MFPIVYPWQENNFFLILGAYSYKINIDSDLISIVKKHLIGIG